MRAGLVLVAALTLVLAGCSAGAGDPRVGSSRGVPAPSRPSVGVTPQSAGVASRAAAEVELAAFTRVNRQTIQRNGHPGGRTFIDALVAAGFRRSAMEVTEDRTTIGMAAPSVQFSVLRKGVCLIGQYGPGLGYHAVTAPPVAGRCLIGKTRRIDW
jgi:hypothetical protein